MAFQQPTRQAASRVARRVSVQDETVVLPPRPSSPERAPEGSQTWVLFSPPTDVTTTSYLTESEHSLETPGRSRLSDLGSLNTVARSEALSLAQPSSVFSAIVGGDAEGDYDDDGELDSLDSHLPDFRSVPGLNLSQLGQQHAVPVFPSHDGLGSFHLDRPVFGTDAQDQIYEFETFNPRKIRRRLDSFDHAHAHLPVNLDEVFTQQEEKRQRIEAWRLDHSRVLVDELQRETRRRQKSLASMHRSKGSPDAEADNLTWHDEDAMLSNKDQGSSLATITRKIVRDFLGIDDTMLSILLGEHLTADYEELSPSTPHGYPSDSHHMSAPTNQSLWQTRMMERLSREIGLLVNHIASHPGAFTTYAAMQRMNLPYAGLPVIPESCDAGMAESRATVPDETSQVFVPEFQPTMDRQQLPVDAGSCKQGGKDQTENIETAGGHFSKEEWEKSLDVKLVLRYLVSRFTSCSGGDASSQPSSTTHAATKAPTQQENAANKIARIRQHHPLTTQSSRPPPPLERRSFKAVVTPSSPVALRHHSSCASQSTKHSARRSSCSSRHYWDIGGSLGTGSVIASNGPMGPMGSWGEV
ncbi:hypothetical protein E4U21_004040 [Claviceps maximensis]|nr:hypothetical protein E4U21_004040 [Claviceps maximensis]